MDKDSKMIFEAFMKHNEFSNSENNEAQDYADSMQTDAPSQKLNTDKKPYNLNDTRDKFAAERGKNAGGSILKELEDHVRELAGPNATIDQAKAAFEKALKAPHPRHFTHTLHNDLLATRGPQVKNRKFTDAGYYPPEGKFDWDYMKRWLQTHILMPYVGGGKYAGTTHYIPR